MKQITVIRALTSKAPKGYPIVELAYKSDDGKTKGMKVLGFGPQKAITDILSSVETGAVLDVEFEQNDRGYWQFKSVKPTGKKEDVAVADAGNSSKAKSNWETTEERAARQVMIVRQSSLSSAVAFLAALEPKGITKTADGVVDVAKTFEAYVFSKETKPTGDIE